MKTLKLFATLRDIAGEKTITVPFEDGQTVRELVQSIEATYPALGEQIIDANGELTGLVHILVHGRHVHWMENGLDTPIKESDIIVLMPPSAGG